MSNTNERDTWESEKWVIDRLVEAVESGEAELRDRLAQRLLDGYRERGWSRRQVKGSGLILLPNRLDPDGVPMEELLEELRHLEISEKRILAISAGSPLKRSEVEAWRALVIERAFDSEYAYELGKGNVCVVLEVKHSDRRRGFLAVRNWDVETGVLVAACASYTDAITALRNAGTVKIDDDLIWDQPSRS